MANIDLDKLKDLNLQELTTDQLSALNYIRGLGNRQGRGIGTTSLTGSELATASEAAQEAPSMVEAGFGPEEYNPQQRYQTRFQQRGAIDEGPTQFNKLEAQTALGQQLPYDNTNVAPSFVSQGGDGNGGEGGGYDRDMGTLGHFGMDAFTGSLEDMGISAGTNFGLASLLGLSPAVAAKFGLMSIFNPTTMLGLMGKVGLGSALDMASEQMANDSMVGDINDSMSARGNGMGPTNEAAAKASMSPQAQAAQALGVGYGGKYGLGKYGEYDLGPTAQQTAIADIENMSMLDRAVAAARAVARGPKGGWMASDPSKYDPITGLHRGQLDNDPMGISAAMGLQSSFGDPFGTGIGRSGGMGGIGGMGPGGGGGFGGGGSGDGRGQGGDRGGGRSDSGGGYR